MKEMNTILENVIIDSWVRHFGHSPFQLNKPHEADAELLEIKGNNSHLLAITIDSVAEEIIQGIYQDPFTMGWITAMSNFSDLAAVGAEPLGIVISVSLEPWRDEKFQQGVAEGIEAACRELGAFVLGGDTNTTSTISLTGCAAGLVLKNQKLTRVGCHRDEVVFLSGRVGSGTALGLRCLAKLPAEAFPEKLYRPVARVKEARVIRQYASCCMDTSDGLLFTLDQLVRLNNLGFVIARDWEELLTPAVLKLCQSTGTPPWFMTASIHGEFELVFTVPQERVDSFLLSAGEINFHPIELGKVQSKKSLEFSWPSGKSTEIDAAPLRNLWAKADGDLNHYLKEYHYWGKKWGLE